MSYTFSTFHQNPFTNPNGQKRNPRRFAYAVLTSRLCQCRGTCAFRSQTAAVESKTEPNFDKRETASSRKVPQNVFPQRRPEPNSASRLAATAAAATVICRCDALWAPPSQPLIGHATPFESSKKYEKSFYSQIQRNRLMASFCLGGSASLISGHGPGLCALTVNEKCGGHAAPRPPGVRGANEQRSTQQKQQIKRERENLKSANCRECRGLAVEWSYFLKFASRCQFPLVPRRPMAS